MIASLTIALVAALVGGATMAWFSDEASSEEVSFQAGTVLIDADTPYMYGVQYKEGQTGELYEIYIDKDDDGEPVSVSYSQIFESGERGLNALAHDNDNGRLYYVDNPDDTLFFYDLDSGKGDKKAGDLKDELGKSARVYGAAYGLGAYWFIFENSDDLYKVTFNEDGAIDEVKLYHEDFTDGEKTFAFGDIAMEIRDGTIYASTTGESSEGEMYFKYNIYTREYEEVQHATAINQQLGYGADGVFYGHETREYTWYTVEPETGNAELFYTEEGPDRKMFSDLACNYQGNWNPGDTDKVRFVVRNEGTKNSHIRVSLSTVWDFAPEVEEVVEVSSCNEDWQVHESEDNGYLYYQEELAPGEEAELCLEVHLKGEPTGNEYQGKKYEIVPTFEAIQSSNEASETKWGNWKQ